MKIRKIIFKDFRSFRGVKEISFLDPLTDEPRPMTVIVGSNGTGKTTILDIVEGILSSVVREHKPVIDDLWKGGCLYLSLQFDSGDLNTPTPNKNPLRFVVGQSADIQSLSLSKTERWDYSLSLDVRRKSGNKTFDINIRDFQLLRNAAEAMQQNKAELFGGLLYFPYDRFLRTPAGGPIEPPPEERRWIFRFTPQDQWTGSLEHLWVWQNYLDLEEGKTNRENLAPFVSMVEDVLGEGRKITIHKGRVEVPPQWAMKERSREKVRIDQLPSGERQVLLLFGELARRLRRGAIVMIDEPEISLHPKMQQLVVDKLRRLAREWDLQVVLATHSEEIVRSVSKHEVINLDYLPTADVSGAVAKKEEVVAR